MEVDVDDINMEESRKPMSVVEIRDESMSELEEGELEDDSDDEPVKDNRITYKGAVGRNDKDILSKRAERFGVSSARKLPEDPVVKRMHMSMGVNSKTRTEALHLYGTGNMQTQDIFLYFDDPPASVEWLSKQECNVVWLDEETCAKALLKHSIKIRGQPDIFDSDSEGEEYVNVSDLRSALPPGGIWRKGRSRNFGHNLLIRYASVSDKKELRPYVPESLKMKEKLFPDGGDESAKKVTVEDDESNPWAGLARQWGSFERSAKTKFGIQDAREIIKEKEVRENLIKKDARDLIQFNRICRLEQKLDPDKISEFRRRRGRSPYKRSWQDDEEPAPRKRLRTSPMREENLQIIVENDSYKPGSTERSRARARGHPVKSHRDERSDSSSSDSSSSSSGDSSSSSSDDSSSSSSSSDDEEDEPPPPVKTPSLKTPWNKITNKFKPESSLLIEIDNDHYRKKRSND